MHHFELCIIENHLNRMIFRKVITSFLVLNSFILSPNIDAQTVQDSLKINPYSDYTLCVQKNLLASDSVKNQIGPLEEIEWLRENRETCENNSPLTRRLSLRIIELTDTQYGGYGNSINIDRKQLIIESLDWAKLALKEDSLYHRNFETLAVAYGARITVAGLRGKAELADSVRIYAEKAVELNPSNHDALHILGRWHYEVSKLNWFIRSLAKLTFNTSPEGSFEQSIDYFNQAIAISNIPVHHYWLGMAYLESGEKEKALERFRYLLDLGGDKAYSPEFYKEKALDILEKHS